jgi:hypothetical protein
MAPEFENESVCCHQFWYHCFALSRLKYISPTLEGRNSLILQQWPCVGHFRDKMYSQCRPMHLGPSFERGLSMTLALHVQCAMYYKSNWSNCILHPNSSYRFEDSRINSFLRKTNQKMHFSPKMHGWSEEQMVRECSWRTFQWMVMLVYFDSLKSFGQYPALGERRHHQYLPFYINSFDFHYQ